MNRKLLFGVILVFTITIVFILVFSYKFNYNKFIVSSDEWNNILDSRSMSTDIYLESIYFNDYSLLIDEENSVIYYSIVDVKNKYNPSIKYSSNVDVSVVISDSLTDYKLDSDSLEIMLYNDNEYRVYKLVATRYPILNVTYKGVVNDSKVDIELYIFDNYVNSSRRVLKSDGVLRIIDDDQEYGFSLKKESLGHNIRNNPVSIFGMEKQSEYLIRVTDISNKNEKYVNFFINNEYKGIYIFGYKKER